MQMHVMFRAGGGGCIPPIPPPKSATERNGREILLSSFHTCKSALSSVGDAVPPLRGDQEGLPPFQFSQYTVGEHHVTTRQRTMMEI